MKKIVCICVAAFFLSEGVTLAQGSMDAYKISQYDLNGTARYLGMGGAFGALGGDISAMGTNPAGLGIYRSSEVVTTLSLSSINSKTDWMGTNMSDKNTKFNFDNIAYVGYFPTGNDEGLVSWNVGFAYNRVKSFNRNYKMQHGQGGYSISDYIAAVTNLGDATGDKLWSTNSYNPYLSQNWLSVLGYNGGLIDSNNRQSKNDFFSTLGYFDQNNKWQPLEIQSADMVVNEKGAIDKYDLSFATNVSNVFFIGATLSITDLDYKMSCYYDEDFGFFDDKAPYSDHLYWDNYSSVKGTGYSFNLGVIARPTDFLRLGVAYNSPTWYKITNYYSAEAGVYVYDYYQDGQNPLDPKNNNLDRKASTPTDFYTNYRVRTNDRWIFSAAAIIGTRALVSVDYELTNYKSMRLYDNDGRETIDNESIKSDFGVSGMLKAGAEFKVTPQFAVRIGGAWQSSPAKNYLRYGETDEIAEVFTPGTRTAYSVDYHTNYYTVGLGYRFTPHFYADLACVYRMQKENVYPFSNVINNSEALALSIPSTLKTNTTRVALTLGYKF